MQVLISHNSPLQLLNMSPITVFALGFTLLVVSIHILSQAGQDLVPGLGHGQDLVQGLGHGQDLVHGLGHTQDLVPFCTWICAFRLVY